MIVIRLTVPASQHDTGAKSARQRGGALSAGDTTTSDW